MAMTCRQPLIGALAVAAIALGACGSDDAAPDGPRTPDAAFPAANGRTLNEVRALGDPADDLVVSPAGQAFGPGENRLGFGVFTIDRDAVGDAEVAIYTAAGPDRPAEGPFPATVHSLATPAAYRAASTESDPDAAEFIYVSEVEAPPSGKLWMTALIATDSGFETSQMPTAKIDRFEDVPAEGEPAPAVHTPTVEDVGGKVSEIDTRNPPSTQHEDDLADVLGKRPAVLLFATPALCQSRVCGPVVDIAEQVKDETKADVAFIHMEIFKDNDFQSGPRPQVRAYHLPTEPWLFVIDRKGRVSTVIEGAFGAEELREAISKAG
jgi:hypothetical protein